MGLWTAGEGNLTRGLLHWPYQRNVPFNPESFTNACSELGAFWFAFFSIYTKRTKLLPTYGARN